MKYGRPDILRRKKATPLRPLDFALIDTVLSRDKGFYVVASEKPKTERGGQKGGEAESRWNQESNQLVSQRFCQESSADGVANGEGTYGETHDNRHTPSELL